MAGGNQRVPCVAGRRVPTLNLECAEKGWQIVMAYMSEVAGNFAKAPLQSRLRAETLSAAGLSLSTT
eukprot:6177352-Pleurochrysis_carterae.AAC.2